MSTDETTPIITKRVDETWKAQIEEEIARQQKAAQPAAATATAAAPGGGKAAETTAPVPAADQRFEALISNLAMEAFIHLGEVPHPATQRAEVNLEQAKYIIDLLGVLERKTQGNLAPAESQQMSELLYQLRMRYVEKTQPPIPPPPGTKEAKR